MTSPEMFSDAGNKAVDRLLSQVRTRVRRGQMARGNIVMFTKAGMKKIAAKHEEVYDSEPLYYIVTELNAMTEGLHFDPITNEDLLD